MKYVLDMKINYIVLNQGTVKKIVTLVVNYDFMDTGFGLHAVFERERGGIVALDLHILSHN
jgi:hypothetical protein